MKTRIKVKCVEIAEREHWTEKSEKLHAAKFCAVMAGSPENEQFFAATPFLQMEVTTARNGIFQVGREYYLDFTAAAPPP